MDFDALAPWYRWVEYAAFGRALERSRVRYVERLRGARRVLVFGEGDGRMLQRMLETAPEAEFVVVEASAAMVGLATARVGAQQRVRYLQAGALEAKFVEQGPYDAVVTCYFLDCLSEREAGELIGRVAAAMGSGGQWLVSDFAIPEAGWRKWHARAWVGTMYAFFQIATGLGVGRLPRITPLMESAGFVKDAETESRWGLIVSGVWRKA